MTIEVKPFQQATVEAALQTLSGMAGPRRFLVADEVGLGKTIVARGVIQRLAETKRRRPLCVLYVCSNLTIARQNMDRLLSFMPTKEERATAIGTIDRPSLLPTQQRPTHPSIHVFQLTPDTAIPTRKGRRRDGRMEERALALVLICRILPTVKRRRLIHAFNHRGYAPFKWWVGHFEKLANRGELGGTEFKSQFREALREILGLSQGQHLPPLLNQFLNNKAYQDLVGTARTALALAALRDIQPDLVIFDEFQRFRDLTENAEELPEDDSLDGGGESIRKRAATRVMHAIRGGSGRYGPALLLLSATPYVPYRNHVERLGGPSTAQGHSSDFFELVSFLADDASVAKHAMDLFAGLREELQKGSVHSERAVMLRDELTGILTPLMSRTERTSVHSEAINSENHKGFRETDLLAADLRQFQEIYECFDKKDEHWIVPFWQSVPLAMQTLGSRYLAWRRRTGMPGNVALSRDSRDTYKTPKSWPHPRLRALSSVLAGSDMVMPWSRPSLPWWSLQGGWKSQGNSDAADGKLLVFSRYRAVPTAISGLLSYAVESRLLEDMRKNKISYESVPKHWLKPTSSLLELFHPSILLAELDPLKAPMGDLRAIRVEMRRQMRERLKQMNIRVRAGRARSHRKSWELLAALEAKAGTWIASHYAWSQLAPVQGDDGSTLVAVALQRWQEAAGRECTEVSAVELDELATLALDAPGPVFLRALLRHWPEAASSENLGKVVDVLWNGLRNYLNKPWFVAALTDRKVRKYPAAIRRAVLEGGLESVLDEHFWYLALEASTDLKNALDTISGALRLRDVSVTFHDAAVGEQASVDEPPPSFRVRCHVAVPLAEGRVHGNKASALGAPVHDEPLRPDEVRKAFNSPFWPKVLVTTSIGQEGLDLHPWCSALAHWDLATGPVALEQREGRITRFAGLSVRRAIASRLREHLEFDGSCDSPWKRLAQLADEKLADDSGLSPWWTVQGAACSNYVFSVAGSEQGEQYEALNQERALYRLVLGMPDQKDLMSILKVQFEDGDSQDVRAACLDLCAYNLRRG